MENETQKSDDDPDVDQLKLGTPSYGFSASGPNASVLFNALYWGTILLCVGTAVALIINALRGAE